VVAVLDIVAAEDGVGDDTDEDDVDVGDAGISSSGGGGDIEADIVQSPFKTKKKGEGDTMER